MSAVRIDHAAALRTFVELFSTRFVHPRDRTVFGRGVNLMTPDVLGYVDVDGVPVEISTGIFVDDRIYGATWRRRGDGTVDARSDCYQTLTALYEALYGDG